MRKAEIQKGIQVYEDKELKKPFSISKVCAQKAVIETALSRSAMNIFTSFLPYILIMTLGLLGISPKGKIG